jgi:hypothetical protein
LKLLNIKYALKENHKKKNCGSEFQEGKAAISTFSISSRQLIALPG